MVTHHRRGSVACLALALTVLFLCLPVQAQSGQNINPESRWPRIIERPGGKITVYQPQLESLKEINMSARAAVSVTLKGDNDPIFGTVWFVGRIRTDRQERLVHCDKVFITNIRFPGASTEQIKVLNGILKDNLPQHQITISLDHLLSMLEPGKGNTEVELNTAPPKIIGVSSPTILVQLDGEPVFKQIAGTDLMRVVNTPYALVQNPSNKAFYIRAAHKWWTTQDLKGQWQAMETPPPAVAALAENMAPVPEGAVTAASGEQTVEPKIMVATEPTELVELWGEADLGFVDGTRLYYVMNTNRDIFINDNLIYLLLSGRWFVTSSPKGPWNYVPPKQLPDEFKKIDPEFERSHVRDHIPDTFEAREARLDTFIPQTAAIKRGESSLKVIYDGAPQFDPVLQTPLEYAVNTPFDIIREGDHYYCCYEAVWYDSASAEGPWSVSVAVPDGVAKIPPTCPLFHVRFVQIYDHTDDTVYTGYTPGYLGCYVQNGIVVFGTGYSYPGWRGTAYYPRPVTYGFTAVYDPLSGIWLFCPPRLGSGTWKGSVLSSLEGTATPWMSTEGWWGAANYTLFGTHIRPLLVAYNEVSQPTSELDNLYLRNKERLAQQAWGRRLPRNMTPPVEETPAIPAATTEPVATEEAPQDTAAADARWEALKRLSEAEAQKREAQQQAKVAAVSQEQDDLYSDKDGNVLRSTDKGWVDIQGNDRDSEVDEDLDRYHDARKRGVTRRRDLIHSNGRMSEASGFDSYVGEPTQTEYGEMFRYLGYRPMPAFGW